MARSRRKNQRDRANPAPRTEAKAGGWGEIVKENAAFEKYYKAQKIVPEEEWDAFMSHFREPLPTSFRITGYSSQAKAVQKIIEGTYFKDLAGDQAQPESFTWYPGNLAWQINLTRKDIRKSEAFVKLHNFLVSETDSGNISRQETVSMIPPLVLDVKPHHKVLDMCAAPGSKTTQLIEMLHSEEGKVPEGLVIANDSNNKRCYMLTHQLKRLGSPNVIVTNHDAGSMPNIYIRKEQKEEVLKFDRILCDVPCSGDGTLRKNLDVWLKWNAANSASIHGLQYRIARRGVEMLATGGKMVYSTCSLNPIEDEAVVHRLLAESEGALELLDVNDLLPGLKFSPGLSHWTVMNRELQAFNSFEDVPDDMKHILRAALFPPKAEDAEKYHLNRCLRVLPHQQNTGGFFVAVLQKVRLLPWESPRPKVRSAEDEKGNIEDNSKENTTETVEAVNERPRSPARKKPKIWGFKEDPFLFFEEGEELWPPLKKFYGISDELDSTLLLTRRKDGKARSIYFTSAIVRDIVKANPDKLMIINTGVKMFIRSDNKGAAVEFRIAQEGAMIILPYLQERRVVVTKEDMIRLLENDDMATPPEIHRLSSSAAAALQKMCTGSVILEYRDDLLHFILIAWKGQTSVRAYVPKSDRIHYLRLCGADVTKFEKNKFESKASVTGDVNENQENDPSIKEECSEENENDENEVV